VGFNEYRLGPVAPAFFRQMCVEERLPDRYGGNNYGRGGLGASSGPLGGPRWEREFPITPRL
jgi:hypothetical protein